MLHDIVSAEAVGNQRLRIRFDDDVEGVIESGQIIPLNGIFDRLRDPTFFVQVRAHPEFGTVCWPNDADLDSEVLYANITGKPVPA